MLHLDPADKWGTHETADSMIEQASELTSTSIGANAEGEAATTDFFVDLAYVLS